MVRAGLIGCGTWGRNLLRALNAQPNATVVSVADKSQSALTFVRRQYPDMDVEFEESVLLEDPSIEAVCIATPAADHPRAVRAAVGAGKHVFIEKPLALSTRVAEELVEAAARAGLVLMAGHTFLYNDAVRHVKQVIDSGELGEIRYVYMQRLNLGAVREDVNVLWNLGPHDVSILLYWLGSPPTEVRAHGLALLRPDFEDVAFMFMRFPSGAGAHVHLSWLDPNKVRTATVVGSKKMLVFDDTSADKPVTIFDSAVDIEQRLASGAPWQTFGEFRAVHRAGDVTIPRIPAREPLANEMEAFVHAVETGEPPLSGGRHAIEVVGVLEEAERALRADGAGS